MSGERILIVEDDAKIQRLLHSHLGAHGYDPLVADDGEKALGIVSGGKVDLVLLDITLPGIDGLEVCRQIREVSSVPIILVTAAERPETKMAALELGGDDYLTKPFHTGELVARIRAVLRRAGAAQEQTPTVIEFGGVIVDLEKREVRRDSEVVHLTKIEYDLLCELATHPDKVLTYDYLLNAVWGPGYDDVRLVHVHVFNLRRKLGQGATGPRHIVAIPGVGYRLRTEEVSA
jgi:two-component system, OmpR family, KDP operon response regulator KdpE